MAKKKTWVPILYPVIWLVRFLLFLRYRITVKGLERLTPDLLNRSGGVLFLPNHPAEIDPVILESILWNKFQPRPLVVEHFYNLKGFRIFMHLVKAMPLPTVDAIVNKWRARKIEKQFNSIADELKAGGSFLIYPSGRLKVTGAEVIGGASFAHKLVQAVPEANIVLVRTVGLWGSKFSRALTGASPDFGKALLECAKVLLKNGLFFAPRREVVVEFEVAPTHFPYAGERLEFNKFLENWYNLYPASGEILDFWRSQSGSDLNEREEGDIEAISPTSDRSKMGRYDGRKKSRSSPLAGYPEPGPEPLKLVSYAFWKEEMPKVLVSVKEQQAEEGPPVSQKIQQEVFAQLSSLCGKPADQIDRKMHLSNDLGLDSLDVVQVYVFLDEHYGASHLHPGDLMSVDDVLQYAAGRKAKHEGPGSAVKRAQWPKEERLAIEIPESKTLQEAFLKSVERNRGLMGTLDAMAGVLSYDKLKLLALILSKEIRKLPGDKIGVLLPASSGAYVIIFAILLGGKVPVMFNWTTGVRGLDHALDLTEVQAVITSEKFLDRMEGGDLGKMEQMLHFIEEMRGAIGFKSKLQGLCLSRKSPEALLKKLNLSQIQSSDSAVILFTSGTESLPKGVPLSHENILSNERASLEVGKFVADDILYGVLPPFHSFGFSVTGILPLLAGLRICYAPDPTDSHGLARDIAEWKPTLFCCAPTFIKAVFRVSKPEMLQSLRLIVSGAEKMPQELLDYVRDHLPHTQLIEGYGVTECSPVVTIGRLDEPHTGVGKPISQVQVMILDQEKMQPLPSGQEGEVCIAGPNVFGGYLGSPRNPFVTVEGKQWYLSGDRGYLDEAGHLILSGRLKRFVKIGGEMVGLGGLEEEVLRLAKEKGWFKEGGEGPALAVSAKEKEAGKPIIVLYATFPVSMETVNAALKDCGYGRIVKISEVRKVDQIPLTGTGKIHYRLLDEL